MTRIELFNKWIERSKTRATWKNTEDPLKHKAPEAEGLYLVGSTHFNPLTDEKIYIVKVGKAKNLKKRIRDYNGTNPLMFHIDYLQKPQECKISENFCHSVLYAIGDDIENCHEWFKVSEADYKEICKLGFMYFVK